MDYRINRHSGRSNGKCRDMPTPLDYKKEQQKYLLLPAAMRQGGIEFW
jgi:hypothetical protein